ncbi:MAG: hypothetical protein JXR77_14000 [Lentisphaeria bacterium]|nr:hypothetical protein [Lentisphaeria bacterium]
MARRFFTDQRIPTLAIALGECTNAGQLKLLAKFAGLPVPTRKAELVDVILKYLDGNGLRRVWEQLDETQKLALAEAVHSSGTVFDAARFQAKYGRQPAWGSFDEYHRDSRPTALRFFFYGSGVLPDDLKERLRVFVTPPAAAMVRTVDPLPAAYAKPFSRWDPKRRVYVKGTEPIPLTVRETERTAQRELLSVLRLVDAGKVSVSDKTHRPSQATIAAVTAVLDGGDDYPYVPPEDALCDRNAGPIRAFAWPLLLQAGKLAQSAGAHLQLTRAGRAALSEAPAVTLRKLWERWQDTTILDELSRIDCVKGQTGKGKHGLTAVASRREIISAALGECPVGQWIASADLFRFIRARGEALSVTRNAWYLYIGELQYGSLGHEGGEEILAERYLLCYLLEYAATLGLIDVALIPPAHARDDYRDLWGTDDLPYFSRYDGLMYLRINALGAYCLDLNDDYKTAPVAPRSTLRVLPYLEVAAVADDIEPGACLALDSYAVRVSPHVWQLQPGKLLAAIEAGRSVRELREFLTARSADPLPKTVLRLFEDVEQRSMCLHDKGLARLVECSDPALAALIANDTRTRKLCLPAGDRHLVVPAASETAFRRGLRDLGYLLPSNSEPEKGSRRKTAGAPYKTPAGE